VERYRQEGRSHGEEYQGAVLCDSQRLNAILQVRKGVGPGHVPKREPCGGEGVQVS